MKAKLIIPISLLVVAWGIFTYIEKQKVRTKSDVIQLSWSDIRKDKLTKITSTIYQDTNELSYTLQKTQGSWHLVEPIQTTIFSDKSIILANAFLTLTPSEELGEISEEDLNSYGLVNPSFKISGGFDGEEYGFIIGSETPVGNQYYIQDLNNDSIVYIIEKQKLEPFTRGISTLINNYFVTQSTDDIIFVSFVNMQKEKILLTNSNSFWVTTDEESSVDWGTKRFLLSLKELRFDARTMGFDVSDENLSSLGIDKENSPQITLIFNNDTTNTLVVGKETKNAYPVYISGEKLVAYSTRDDIRNIFSTLLSDFKTK